MKLELVDIETNPHEEEVGTCEFCMSIEMVSESVLVFKKNNGGLVRVKVFIWSWGLYDEGNIENIVDLTIYVNEQKFDEERELDYSWSISLIYEYKYRKD